MIAAIARHLRNWAEVYLWVPVSLIGIYGAAQLAYLLSGRRPAESPDFLVDYAGKAVEVVAVIALTSVAKQALGSWMTKEEKLANPGAYALNSLATIIIFVTISYLFTH